MNEVRPSAPAAHPGHSHPSAHGQHSQLHGQPVPAMPVNRPAARPASPVAPQGAPKVAGIPTLEPEEIDLDPIALVEDDSALETSAAPAAPAKKIKAFGIQESQTHQYKREPKTTGTGSVRVRSFHGKLSEQGLEYIDNAINSWLDQHPEIEVKNVTSSIGMFDGKMKEPALILNIWY